MSASGLKVLPIGAGEHSSKLSARRGVRPDAETQRLVVELIREGGVRTAARGLGVREEVLTRIAIAEPVTRGSLALIREALRERATSGDVSDPRPAA